MMSNHFFYTDFGVRESSDESAYGRRYLCDGTPGTGFIERSSESHSYHEFVRDRVADQHPTYWKLLFNREPNYEREQNRARAALAAATTSSGVSLPSEKVVWTCKSLGILLSTPI